MEAAFVELYSNAIHDFILREFLSLLTDLVRTPLTLNALAIKEN